MEKYRTGAICDIEEIQAESFLKGKYFTYNFEPHQVKSIGDPSLELTIEALSENKAQQSYELFISALTFLYGHLIFPLNELPSVHPYSKSIDKKGREMIPIHFSMPNIFKAAQIATKASYRRKYSYSLYKYLIGCNHHSNYLIDLDPSHSEYIRLSKNPLDHMRYGYAILVFYSILEELGVEVRATSNNPSKIDGRWNPKVKDDLEKRLMREGVLLHKKARWNIRSKSTNIHKRGKLLLKEKEGWAAYSVRDSKIEIIDAINYLSWLRSKIVAHKFGNELESISIYDVASANFLIRQLLYDIFEQKLKIL